MKILVIGKSGQLAKELAARQGELDMTFLGRPELDLADLPQISKVIGPIDFDLLINAAAYTAVDQAETEADLAQKINADAPTELAKIAAAKGAAMVHISTDYVFDGQKAGPYLPDDATSPLNVYGQSKLDGEIGVVKHLDRRLILRTSWVFSPLGANFVNTMLRLADRETLSIVNNQTGHPTHAGDLANAILSIAPLLVQSQSNAPFWGLHHYTNQGATNWAEFAAQIFTKAKEVNLISQMPEITGIPASDYPTPATRPMNSRLDCTSFDDFFPNLRQDWQDALADMIISLQKGVMDAT